LLNEPSLAPISIAIIDATSFMSSTKSANAIVFLMYIREIYTKAKEARDYKEINFDSLLDVTKLLLVKYIEYTNVFSKTKSNKLLLYRLSNYRIKLKGSVILEYCLLYNIF
jgi:hypothetical protein